MSRVRVALPVAILLGAFLALVVAAPASAHSQVIATNPADGSTITALPAEITITANEDLLDLTGTGQGFALYAVGADGTKYGGTPLSLDGPTVSTAVPATMPPGTYTVLYQIVSADTHPVAGEFHFTYDPTGTPVAGDPEPTAQPVGGDGLTATGTPSGAEPAPTAATTGTPAPSLAAAALSWAVPVGIIVVVAIVILVVLIVRGRRD